MIGINWGIVAALAKRDLRLYLSSPTGYVFITLFVFLSAVGAFWQGRFFANNLANLALLNDVFPYLLLLFVPALTMNAWSEERRSGTDELLLTLPAADLEIVLGKYLSVVGIYTASLLLSLSHVVVLFWLGSPDLGLMIGNYLGYWLLGLSLLTIGMLASLLTRNATVAFVLGALLCGLLVMTSSRQFVPSEWLYNVLAPLSVNAAFDDFSRGIISLSGLLYFASVSVFVMYLNVLLLSRRHWPSGAQHRTYTGHQSVRAVAVAVALIAVNAIVARAEVRVDATAERLHSLSDKTREMIDDLPEERAVLIQAFVSPDVPREYVETRTNLIGTLRELSAIGGDRVQVLIHETEQFTDRAREARETFGIGPREVVSNEGARLSRQTIYLGVALTSGPREVVIPFFDRGLPVEYELVRSIRVAADADRRRIGVLNTAVQVFGGMDFQTMRQTPAWRVVDELRKQYEVVQISADEPITESLDGLLAVLPSSLTQAALDNLKAFIEAGNPTLLLDDPLPMIDPMLAPILPPGAGRNPFQQQQTQPPPKGDFRAFYESLGLVFNVDQIVWDAYNPLPELSQLPAEIVFVSAQNETADAFSNDHPATSGLQQLIALYAGYLFATPTSPYTWQPLLRTGRLSGQLPFNQILQQGFFGVQFNRNPRRTPNNESYVLAGQLTGRETDVENAASNRPVNAIVIADIDMISDQFFMMREQGLENLNFDNVGFVLNCMDLLVGDSSFVELRKKRVRHRTLTAVEDQTREFIEQRLADEQTAETAAQEALAEAQQRLDARVAEVRERTDLDDQTKRIMVQNIQEVENRRFEVARANITARKDAQIAESQERTQAAVAAIQSRIKVLAVALPPVPVAIIGLFIFFRRRRREDEGAAAVRRLRGSS